MSRLIRCLMLYGGLAALCLLTAAPAQATHPRPKGATPIRMSLVPAYAACAAPNRTHGPPLAFASCNPPAQASAQATVGTPDAFGGAANSTSYLLLRAIPGDFPRIDGGHADRHRAQRRALRADGRALRHGQCLRPRRLLGRDAILVHVPPHGPLERDRSGRGNGSRHGPGLHDRTLRGRVCRADRLPPARPAT